MSEATAVGAPEILLTRPEVERQTGISTAHIYSLMRRDLFPKPLKISPGCVRWRQSEITEWVNSRPRSHGVEAA